MLLFFPHEAQVFVCLHKKHCFLFLIKPNFLFECEKDLFFLIKLKFCLYLQEILSSLGLSSFACAQVTLVFLVQLQFLCLCATNSIFSHEARVIVYVQ